MDPVKDLRLLDEELHTKIELELRSMEQAETIDLKRASALRELIKEYEKIKFNECCEAEVHLGF